MRFLGHRHLSSFLSLGRSVGELGVSSRLGRLGVREKSLTIPRSDRFRKETDGSRSDVRRLVFNSVTAGEDGLVCLGSSALLKWRKGWWPSSLRESFGHSSDPVVSGDGDSELGSCLHWTLTLRPDRRDGNALLRGLGRGRRRQRKASPRRETGVGGNVSWIRA